MSNIISRYKAILPVSLFALSAQGVMAQDASEADTINVAFRKADARDVITPVSTVNVKNLLEKNYNTYSLDNMQALAAGYNGSLWNQELFWLSLLAGSRPGGRLTFLCFAKEK